MSGNAITENVWERYYRECMGMLLQRMYGNAITGNVWECYYRECYYRVCMGMLLQRMYGNAITENVRARSHICELLLKFFKSVMHR